MVWHRTQRGQLRNRTYYSGDYSILVPGHGVKNWGVHFRGTLIAVAPTLGAAKAKAERHAGGRR